MSLGGNAGRLFFLKLTSRSRCMSSAAAAARKVDDEQRTQLFRKLAAMGVGGTEVNVAQALNDWVDQGHSIRRYDIRSYANQLRRFKKFEHAAQLYDWADKSGTPIDDADHAVRIDLLAKTKGIESAEDYFNSLDIESKTKKTHGALLSCYCQLKMVDKATELFNEMKRRDSSYNTTLSYNNMMALYTKIGQPEKVAVLYEEMERKNISPDVYTYNQLMNSYASLQDYDAVEGVLQKMKAKSVHCDWFTLGNLATIYVNAGFLNKANSVLTKMEEMKQLNDPEAFHTLIKLYGRTSNAPGVERSWNLLQASFPKPSNLSYLFMLLALLKLGDFEQLQSMFKKWESECSNYDVRICNVAVEAYLDRDMIDEANLVFESLVKRNVEPSLRTHELFMKYYLKKRDMGMAMKSLEAGADVVSSGSGWTKVDWFPQEESVKAFADYFRDEEKDTDSAAKFAEIMKKVNKPVSC